VVDNPQYARPYLAEVVHARATAALRMHLFDVLAAQRECRVGITDEEQLIHAAAEGCALLAFNFGDFVVLHGHWMNEG